jgi:hypothetical protein
VTEEEYEGVGDAPAGSLDDDNITCCCGCCFCGGGGCCFCFCVLVDDDVPRRFVDGKLLALRRDRVGVVALVVVGAIVPCDPTLFDDAAGIVVALLPCSA